MSAPSFEKVDLRWIREVASRNAGLIAEEIHLTELTRDLADAAVSDHGMKIIQSNFPGNQLNGIFQGLHPAEVGNFDPPFQDMSLPYTDVKVREAINRAIDRETIKNTLFSGRVTTSPQIGFYSNLPGWDPRWLDEFDEHYGYDPERARELLAEAGYPDGFEVRGILMNIFGFPESVDLVQAMQVQLQEVGIDLKLEEWEFSNFFSAWTSKDPNSFGLWVGSPSYKTVFAQLSLFNRSSGAIHLYETEVLDGLFDKLSKSGRPRRARPDTEGDGQHPVRRVRLYALLLHLHRVRGEPEHHRQLGVPRVGRGQLRPLRPHHRLLDGRALLQLGEQGPWVK